MLEGESRAAVGRRARLPGAAVRLKGKVHRLALHVGVVLRVCVRGRGKRGRGKRGKKAGLVREFRGGLAPPSPRRGPPAMAPCFLGRHLRQRHLRRMLVPRHPLPSLSAAISFPRPPPPHGMLDVVRVVGVVGIARFPLEHV